MTETTNCTQEHSVTGEELLAKNEAGHTLIEIPLTVGVVGAMLLPVWVALGAMAALASNYTLEVEPA